MTCSGEILAFAEKTEVIKALTTCNIRASDDFCIQQELLTLRCEGCGAEYEHDVFANELFEHRKFADS